MRWYYLFGVLGGITGAILAAFDANIVAVFWALSSAVWASNLLIKEVKG